MNDARATWKIVSASETQVARAERVLLVVTEARQFPSSTRAEFVQQYCKHSNKVL